MNRLSWRFYVCIIVALAKGSSCTPFGDSRLAPTKQPDPTAAGKTSDPILPPSQETPTAPTSVLHFQGEHTCVSKAFPAHARNDLVAFLLDKDNQLVIYSSNHEKEKAKFEPVTPTLKRLWEESCDEYYGNEVKQQGFDNIVTRKTTVSFPGLQLHAFVASTTKTIFKQVGNHKTPVIESYLIGEMQEISGLKPVKWIFSKLTGFDKRPKNVYSKPDARVVASVCVIDNNKNNAGNSNTPTVAVQFKVKFDIVIKFPASLLKILPMSREKVNQQGSNSVLKKMTKDIDVSVTRFADMFSAKYADKYKDEL